MTAADLSPLLCGARQDGADPRIRCELPVGHPGDHTSAVIVTWARAAGDSTPEGDQ